MRVTIVIPVYNEAERIGDCLQAIARQTVKPFEVIVVDNNSTDGTAVLAARFPFVRILHEPRQGVVYARDRGFDASRGDIIGRIDADTIIDADWVATVEGTFGDPGIGLVTGSVRLQEISASRLVSRVDLAWRRHFARHLKDEMGLQGANMALRRSVWTAVRGTVCHRSGLHEDFDLGLHAYQRGYRGRYVENLRVSITHRQLHADFAAFSRYALASPRTYLAHGNRNGRIMYQAVTFVVLFYPVITIMAQGYDRRTGRFSIAQLLFGKLALRPDPAVIADAA